MEPDDPPFSTPGPEPDPLFTVSHSLVPISNQVI